jgi:hypothetical protein
MDGATFSDRTLRGCFDLIHRAPVSIRVRRRAPGCSHHYAAVASPTAAPIRETTGRSRANRSARRS